MSGSKNSFTSEYTVVEVIQNKKNKKTSIVRNLKGQYYILKKFYMSNIYALNEIALMRTIKHPNIVAFHDLITEKGHLHLIQEYCQEGDLAYHIRRQIRKKRCYFPEKIVAKWMVQLLLALEYLHAKKIMHRDIRPQNIFLTSSGNLKLGCFGSSKVWDDEPKLSSTVIKSSYYMAPQCLDNQGYDEKVDIWALGCLLYEICTLKQIFQQKNIIEQANLILKTTNKELPPIYSKELQQILNKCLIKDSKQRVTAKSLLREPYFVEEIKKLINEKPEPSRIPIKHYNIHLNNLVHKKKVKNVQVIEQKYKVKIGIKQVEKPPKIQQNKKQRNIKRLSSKQILRTPALGEKQQGKKQLSKQKIRQNSKQMPRRKSIKRLPSIENNGEKNTKNRSLSKRKAQNQNADKEIKSKPEIAYQSPKGFLPPPPMLPKPSQKKVEKKNTQNYDLQTEESSTNFSQTMKQKDLSQQLAKLKGNKEEKQKQSFNQQQVKSALNKIFFDLGLKEQDEEEFSFELEDENLARLTLKKNDGNELIQTYKSKLQQLIAEINYKYSPHMQTIQQHTQQFDSNTFANIRR